MHGKNFHKIRLRTNDDKDKRSVSWLELFFDLVFVVIIAKIAHSFANDVTWGGFTIFIFMFLSIWWVWNSIIYFTERFKVGELITRIYSFLMMIPVIGMAIYSHNGFGENYSGFAISYLISRIVFFGIILYAAVRVKEYRPVGYGFLGFTSLSMALITGSLFIESEIRLVLWAVAIIMEVIGPSFTIKQQVRLPHNIKSTKVDERYGLLTIIVIGEVIANNANTLAGSHHINSQIIINGLLALGLGVSIWLLYFDSVSKRKLPATAEEVVKLAGWMYLHIFLNIAIVASAVGIAVTVLGEASFAGRVLLAGAVGAIMIFVNLIEQTMGKIEGEHSNNIFSNFFVKLLLGLIAISVPLIFQSINIPVLFAVLILMITIQQIPKFRTLLV